MVNNTTLSVCIPTYNRAHLLERAVRSVFSQIRGGIQVEVIVSDNASTDETRAVCERLLLEFPALRYARNPQNIGWDGNTAKCVELASGDYIAMLGDDDFYLPGLLSRILQVVGTKEYSLINLNYLCENRPSLSFASDADVEFIVPYNIMQYPSVGHFSGFIYNARIAKMALRQISRAQFNSRKMELLYLELAVRVLEAEPLPSFFLGERFLVAGQPPTREYKWILGPYYLTYKCYAKWHEMELITSAALEFRKGLLVDGLPRAILVSIYELDEDEVVEITGFYVRTLSAYPKFWIIVYPLLLLSHFGMFRSFVKGLNILGRNIYQVCR